ncbi:MAG: DUF4918 family protein [Chitinophagaceae bacterium]|nr:DUF4918 family protein [Chitinophagaceae bacterium]MCW5929438.1 DUF4918 family protein [Chitinophagaceae bacterium]
METFAEKVIAFNKNLRFNSKLPDGIRIMNPFRENKEAMAVSSTFYRKYYNDDHRRHIILGINPGRFGAGLTGIPFTDPKRLVDKCGIPYNGKPAHEPSSVFIYEMIDAWGGAESFYRSFFINSVCPLGFTIDKDGGKNVNYNYYDSRELEIAAGPFIRQSIKQLIKLGVFTDTVFCFGTGKNERFLNKLNGEYRLFGEIIALEHPRFIMQYKSKHKDEYIDKYLSAFRKINHKSV